MNHNLECDKAPKAQGFNQDLTRLKNEELHSQLQYRVKEERRLTHQILQLIAEVDRRKLYLPMAYPSLFEYLVQGIGYTAASAQRRIDAARLMQQVPDLGIKIENGSLKLTQISLVQQTLRLVRKRDNTCLMPMEKEVLLKALENKSGAESELLLAQRFSLPPQIGFKKKVQKDESVRIELTLSKEQMKIVEQAKALLSHALPGASLTEALVSLAERYIKQRTGLRNCTSAAEGIGRQNQKNLRKEVPLFGPISATVKKLILRRDQGCQFKDSKNGKICGAKQFLEVDHIQPRFAGGDNEIKNLRVLCGAHNKFRYRARC